MHWKPAAACHASASLPSPPPHFLPTPLYFRTSPHPHAPQAGKHPPLTTMPPHHHSPPKLSPRIPLLFSYIILSLFVFYHFPSLSSPFSSSSSSHSFTFIAADDLICPQGFFYQSADVSCTVCPVGYYCPGDNTRYSCEGHQYQDHPQQIQCKNCTEGSYTPNNVLCIACRHNEFCPNGIDRISCSASQFFNQTSLQCEQCPSDHFCIDGKKYLCPAGYYISNLDSDAESLCLECPVGYHCPGGGKRNKCINETYSDLAGQTECSVCSPGYATLNSSVSCLQCSQNDYCPDGMNRMRCEAGTYFSPGTSSCINCESGFYCIDAKRYPCSPGTYSNGTRQYQCVECPAGTRLPTARGETINDCIPCEIGTYSDIIGNSARECLKCPTGTWSGGVGLSNVDQCTKCQAGTYQNLEGQTAISSCVSCPPGTISSEESASCTECNLGEYASGEGNTACLSCDPGSFANETGLAECHLCPPGHYNVNSGSTSVSACVQCPNGGSSAYGGNSSDICDSCAPGYKLVGTSCELCPPGFYSNVSSALECTPCDPGFYQPLEGANSIAQCLPCPAGEYAPQNGTSTCTKCPSGTWSVEEAAVEYPCQECAAGYTSHSGDTDCFACPIGSYAPAAGTPECILCPLGQFSNMTNSTQCMNCSAGSYANNLGSTVCTLCQPGTYNAHIAATSPLNCTKCPKGTYSSTVSATSLLHCIICPKGAFCDEEGMSSPNQCPKGTYSTIEGSQTIYDCASCPKGTYSSKEGATSETECESCPLGRYGPNEGAVFLQECEYCPPGHYSTTQRAVDQSACIPCPRGQYSPLASSSCIPCPLSTYNPLTGASNVTQCIACPNSQTTRNTGSSSGADCLNCREGFYMTPAMTCEACSYGTYFDPTAGTSSSGSSSAESLFCKDCGKGYYQPEETQIGNDSCIACPPGTFGPLENNQVCTPCGKGNYATQVAATDSTTCIPCPAGTWSQLSISNSSSNCIPCAPGTYSNVTGATASTTCKLCPIGYKSETEGSLECVACSREENCFTQGNSFEMKSQDALQESISIFDPKSVSSTTSDSYLTLKLSIPFGVFGFCFIVAVSIISCLLIILRCQYKKLLRKVDFFFSMQHYVRIGSSQTNMPSALGGLFSVIVIVAFLGFFTSILMDFVGNNKIVLENFLLENSESVRGSFVFEAFVVGRHKQCDSDITLSGFDQTKTDWVCEQRVYMSDQLEGCLCRYNCLDCAPTGNSHQVQFDFKGDIMSQKIMFSVYVPHFVEGTSYVVNGSMHSGNSVFSGDASPHTFSFSLNNARYVAISNIAAFVEIFGVQQETTTKGYTMQMTGKIPGSSQPNDDSFVLSEGLQVIFDIQRSFGTYVSKETIRQNLFTFFAQVLTILSMLTAIGALALRFIEKRVEQVEILMGRKERPKLPPTPDSAFFSPMWQQQRMHMGMEWGRKEDTISQSGSIGEEEPRSVGPFVLQQWKQQLRSNRLGSAEEKSPSASKQSTKPQRLDPSEEDTISSDDVERPEKAATMDTLEEQPRRQLSPTDMSPNSPSKQSTLQYDPEAVMEQIRKDRELLHQRERMNGGSPAYQTMLRSAFHIPESTGERPEENRIMGLGSIQSSWSDPHHRSTEELIRGSGMVRQEQQPDYLDEETDSEK